MIYIAGIAFALPLFYSVKAGCLDVRRMMELGIKVGLATGECTGSLSCVHVYIGTSQTAQYTVAAIFPTIKKCHMSRGLYYMVISCKKYFSLGYPSICGRYIWGVFSFHSGCNETVTAHLQSCLVQEGR